MRFSWLKMSSRRVKTVEPSCGTNAIADSLRILARAGKGAAQNPGTSISKCGALDIAFLHPEFLPVWRTTLFKMRRHVDSVGRIKPDLVAQGADRYPEHARRAGAVAAATREGLQHQLALDLADGGADQQRHDLVRRQRRRQSFRRMDRGFDDELLKGLSNGFLKRLLCHQHLPINARA